MTVTEEPGYPGAQTMFEMEESPGKSSKQRTKSIGVVSWQVPLLVGAE
jgi:hypothetical protein